MTGESIPTRSNWRELLPYYRKLISASMILLGGFLMIEHLFMFECFDLLDFIGHEYYGLALIIGGFLLSIDYGQWHRLELWRIRNWFR